MSDYGQNESDGGAARLALPVGDRDHVQGPASAPVTLVEYGDYECPYCRAAVPIVHELQALLGDQLRFVFRHFPLTGMHAHAQHAAEAAEAAAAQGVRCRHEQADDATGLQHVAPIQPPAARGHLKAQGASRFTLLGYLWARKLYDRDPAR